jgi:general secretion pathway protein C
VKKFASVLTHVLMLAVVCAVAAYWIVRIMTPQPTAAPPPLAAPPPRDADPVLSARMFGLVQAPSAAVVTNVQVAGVFSAGTDSSAVLTVDGKPPRVYVVGQEISPGTRLVAVEPEAVVLEGVGGRQEIRTPARPMVSLNAGGSSPPPAYSMQGNSLSLPSSSSSSSFSPAPVMPAPNPAMPQGGAPVGVPLPTDQAPPGTPLPTDQPVVR